MKVTKAYIERVRSVNADYQHLELASVDPALMKMKPGQSIFARLVDKDMEIDRWEPYLPEQWWPIGVTPNGTLLVERPRKFTYEPQQNLLLMGPIGQPYRFRQSLRNVLLVAYDTEPTPLTIMCNMLLSNNISTTLVLLGTAREYDTGHLPPEIEVIQSNDALEWDDMVMTLGWADQVFVVVSPDDEVNHFGEVFRLFKERRAEIPRNYLFGVFQPLLPCGVGACTACTLRMTQGTKLACIDGPAFDLSLVRL